MGQSRPVSHEMGCFAKICEANCESNYDSNLKSLYSWIPFLFVSGGSLIELLSLWQVQKRMGNGLKFESETNRFYMVSFFRFFISLFAVICAGFQQLKTSFCVQGLIWPVVVNHLIVSSQSE